MSSSENIRTAVIPDRRTAGWDLLGSELSVLFRRRRTWAMLAAVALIPILLAIAVRLSTRPLLPGRARRSFPA